MNLDKFIKSKDYQHVCPFCDSVLTALDDIYFTNHGQKGYQCNTCYVPGVHTKSGRPFSRYNIGVMENVQLGNSPVANEFAPQIVVDETFYIHHQDNKWYNVHNDLAKGQTVMVLTEPMTEEHLVYVNEAPVGLVWITDLVVLPFIDSWNLSDESGTIGKIRTYLLFY